MSIMRAAATLAAPVVLAISLLGPGTALGQLSDEEINALDERVARPTSRDPLDDVENRAIFVLTVYNKTNFFIDETGHYRGFEYDIVKGYEQYVNRGRKKASQRYVLVFVPMRFEDILPALAEGRGDIAAANFTVTKERAQIADFAEPYLPEVDEIVITHRDGPAIKTVDDLAGRSLYVLAGSSYIEHLMTLNKRFVSNGRKPMTIVEADPDFDHADILELVNSGAVELTVADEHIANVWSPIFPKIVVKSDPD